MTASLRVLLLRLVNSAPQKDTEIALRISGIAVISSIAIHETLSLSSLQFQVLRKTKSDAITRRQSNYSTGNTVVHNLLLNFAA